MSNMSHCRFENTLRDLADCDDAIAERLNDPAAEELSRTEFEAAVDLILKAQDLVLAMKEHAGLDDEDELTGDHIRHLLAGDAS